MCVYETCLKYLWVFVQVLESINVKTKFDNAEVILCGCVVFDMCLGTIYCVCIVDIEITGFVCWRTAIYIVFQHSVI